MQNNSWTPDPSLSPTPPLQDADTENFDTMPHENADLLLSLILPPCLSIFQHASSTSLCAGKLAGSDSSDPVFPTLPEDIDPASPFVSAFSHTAYLTVHNISTTAQEFVLYPVAPKFSGDQPPAVGIRHHIFQASRTISPGNGSITFALPCGPPLNWGTKLNPGIIVMTGCIWKQDTAKTTVFPTHWNFLSSPDLSGTPSQNSCVMTMPNRSEARFLTSDEMKAKGFSGPEGLSPGTIAIQTDGTFAVDDEGMCHLLAHQALAQCNSDHDSNANMPCTSVPTSKPMDWHRCTRPAFPKPHCPRHHLGRRTKSDLYSETEHGHLERSVPRKWRSGQYH